MLCRALGTKYIHFTVPAVHSHRIHSAGLNLRSRSRFHAHAHARTRAPSICLSVWLLLLLQALLAPAILSVCAAFCSLLFALALARSCPTSKPLLHQATVALSQFKLSDLLMLYSSGLL